MKTSIYKKVALLFTLATLLVLAEACFSDCNCPPIANRFFDFQNIKVSTSYGSSSTAANVPFRAELLDIDLLAEAKTQKCRKSWFINSALACDCLSDGDQGLKFPVTEVRIFSDANFSEELAAGELLNDVTTVFIPGTSGEEQLLSDVEDYSSYFSIYSKSFQFMIKGAPTVDSTHVFTVEIEKSNGEIVRGESEAFTWE